MKHLLSLLAAGSAAMAGATAEDLGALLDAASPGDVIETEATDFGAVSLRNYTFEPPVTVKFHPDARLETLTLRSVRGVHFDGATVIAGETISPKSAKAIYVQRGGDVVFRNMDVSFSVDGNPMNDGTGIFADDVDGIVVEDSDFHDVRNGVIILSSNDATVIGSRFSQVLSDGVAVSGTSDIDILENLCIDFAEEPSANVHPDCIQLHVGSRGVANQNARVAGNAALMGHGASVQGIFVKSKLAGVPHRDVVVERNIVKVKAPLAIYGENVDGFTVRANYVLAAPDAPHPVRILVRDPSTGVTIEENTSARIDAPPHAVLENNTILD